MKKAWAVIWSVLKWILLGVIVVVLIAFAVKGRVNLGAIIGAFFGGKRKGTKPLVNRNPKFGGTVVGITPNADPLRDKREMTLDDGTTLILPKGIIDTDVKEVIKVKEGVYSVQAPTTGRLTDVFGNPATGG